MAKIKLPTTRQSLLDGLAASPQDSRAFWDRFVDVYGPHLRRWLQQFKLPDADTIDIIQEAYRSLVANIERYDATKGMFRKWLKTVANNAARTYLNRQRRDRQLGIGSTESLAEVASPGGEDELVQSLDAVVEWEILQAAITQARQEHEFGDRSWEMFKMRLYEGLDDKEIADRLTATTGTTFSANNVNHRIDGITEVLRHIVQSHGGSWPDESEAGDERRPRQPE